MVNYSKYFNIQRRVSSKTKIAVLKGELLEGFLTDLLNDPDIESETKLFIIVCLCGGLRVSEGLSLKKSAFMEEDGDLFGLVDVLKKRSSNEERYFKIHPIAKDFVQEKIKHRIGDKVFNFHRSTALNRIKAAFDVEGICNHSLRHSMVSYYLFNEKMTTEEVSKVLKVNPKIVDVYAHMDEKRRLKSVFKGGK